MVCARLLLLACLACFAPGCGSAQHPGDDTSSADDAPRNTAHRTTKKHKHRDEDEDAPTTRKTPSHDASDEEDAGPKKPAKKAAKKPANDDDDDAPKKPAKKAAAKKPADDDDDDAPKKPAKKAAKKPADDDDDDAPKKPAKKASKKPANDDDDDAPKKPAKKAAAKKPANDDDDDAPKKPAKKVTVKKPADDEDDAPKKPVRKPADEDDESAPKKAAKIAVKKPADEDEEAPTKPARKTTAKKSAGEDTDDDASAAKPKAVAVKAKAKSKSADDKTDDKPREPKPEEPPKKQRSIEEDVAVDDPLATKPPVASADESDATGDGATTDAVEVAAAPHGTQLQDRALTTPEGQIELHAGLPISVLTVTDATGMSTSSTSEGLALGVAYGVNAKAEVGLDYTLGLSPGKLEGPVTLHGAYSLAHAKLDFAAAAAIAIDFNDVVDPTTMTTSSQTAASLQLGAWARYHATPTLSIFSGLPGTPNTTTSLSRLAFALPVLSYQIQIGLSGKGATAITVPIGLGYQASPKLYTFASVNLANIRIANTSNAFLFKDYIPIAIGGFYSFDTFSLGASLADDLKQGFGYLRFELTARYLLH